MNLPDNAIKEFQTIYENELGEEISMDEARTKAEDFLRLFKLISEPINSKDHALKQ